MTPGGSFWIYDLITHDSEALNQLFKESYGTYLETLGGLQYRQNVFDYIDYEDTPRSIGYQLVLMNRVGFTNVKILHKSICVVAFGGMK
ncbi:hypothetical protein [Pedobacter sp. JCM 36344]|uniref:hypothetical protein n=1 Tax=Pedobacter sp. JCM 36344 TaxID=3374280 RepID=UPI003978723C